MDYKNTADMISLGLFVMLTGVILIAIPDLVTIHYYGGLGPEIEYKMYDLGLAFFNISGLFLFVVLVRWAYRVATRHSRDFREHMVEMEKP